ncbi:MAG TPA: hypothetical protein DF613_12805 [Lachnospiraceae bacterium]|nr:hypothetical protein [Lachnospiraceae bacterium]
MKCKQKKIGALVLTAALAVQVLGGCQKQAGDVSGSGNAQGSGGTSGTADVSAPADGQAAGSQTGSSGGEKAMGRYLESEMELPEGVGKICGVGVLEDGSLRLAGEDENSISRSLWSSADGGASWEKEELPEALSMDRAGQILSLSFGPKGEMAALDPGYKPIIFGADGSGGEVSFSLPDGTASESIFELHFAPTGELVGLDGSGSLYLLDAEQKKASLCYNESGNEIAGYSFAGGNLFTYGAGGIQVYDTATGELKDTDSVLNDNAVLDSQASDGATPAGGNRSLMFTAAEGEDEIYFCNDTGIYHHILGGSVSEQIANGSLNSLSNPSMSRQEFGVLPGGDFFILVFDAADSSTKLLRYTWSADTPAMPDTELRMFALEDSSGLRQAIAIYQKNNPDVYVHLEVGLTGGDGKTAEDAIRSLNTDLLAGNGPDLLVLDGMPVDSYIEKDMLLDIHDVVDTVNGGDGLFENAVRAYERDGAVYAVPTRLSIPIIQSEARILDAAGSLESLADTAEKLQAEAGGSILRSADAKIITYLLYRMDSANWVGENGGIDETAVTNFLTQAARLYQTSGTADSHRTEWSAYDDLPGAKRDGVASIGLMMGTQGERIELGNLDSMWEYMEMTSVNNSNEQKYPYRAMQTGSHAVFIPMCQIGVSSRSAAPDKAKALVQELIGEQIQSTGDGFPINKAAFAKMTEENEVQSGLSIGSSDGEGGSVSLEMSWPNAEEIKVLSDMLEQADTPALTDHVIEEIVLEQGALCLGGRQTPEAAAANIMQKVKLYLAE